MTDLLTTESLKVNAKSAFDLVNYAILLAKDMMATGRESRVHTSYSQNTAYLILAEIGHHKDYLSHTAEQQLKD